MSMNDSGIAPVHACRLRLANRTKTQLVPAGLKYFTRDARSLVARGMGFQIAIIPALEEVKNGKYIR